MAVSSARRSRRRGQFCITISHKKKAYARPRGGGFVWHEIHSMQQRQQLLVRGCALALLKLLQNCKHTCGGLISWNKRGIMLQEVKG